jgi:hypothetical protein
MKPLGLTNANSTGPRKPRENRFELWVQRRRGNGLLLLVAFFLLLFTIDSIVAFALVLSGLREAQAFYVTGWLSKRPADQAALPGLREVLLSRPRLYRSYEDRWEADGLLGWRMVRNFLAIENWKGKSFWFMTNDQGFPPVAEGMLHYAVPKPSGVFRVVILGGSTVEGLGVMTPLDSLPAKLQVAFEAARREQSATGVPRVEVINAGVDGYASDDEYLYFLADLLRFQPDLVLSYDGWNDAEMLPTWISGDRQTGPYRNGIKQKNADRVNRSFTTSGAITFAVAVTSQHALSFLDGFAIFKVLHVLLNRTVPLDVVEVPYEPAFSQKAAHLYIENRERMLFLAAQNHIRFASFLQPIMGVDGKEYSEFELARAGLISPTVMRERQVFYSAVRPLLQTFRETHKGDDVCVADISETAFKGHPEPLYADDGHLRSEGNQTVAESIVTELRHCGLLPF